MNTFNILAQLRVENTVSFTHEGDDYCLTVFVDDLDTEDDQGHVRVWMNSAEATRLRNLVNGVMP